MPEYRALGWLGAGLLAFQLWGAETPKGAVSEPASLSSPQATPETLKELQERIANQEEQIRRLQQAVDEQQALLERAVAAVSASASSPSTPVDTVAARTKASSSGRSRLTSRPLSRPCPTSAVTKSITRSLGAGSSRRRTFWPSSSTQHDVHTFWLRRFHVVRTVNEYRQWYRHKFWCRSLQQLDCGSYQREQLQHPKLAHWFPCGLSGPRSKGARILRGGLSGESTGQCICNE